MASARRVKIPKMVSWALLDQFHPRCRERAVLAWTIVLSTLLRLWLSFRFFGFHSGDDLEIVQAGFMRALGHGYIPWELRNLFVSDVLISPVLSLASFLGIESVRHLCWIATFPFITLASVNIVLVYYLGLRWLNDGRAATLAASLYAFHWIPLGYGSTVYPRTASTTCVLVAVVLICRARRPMLGFSAAGVAMGVAFTCRYSEAIFLLPIAAMLLVKQSKPTEKLRLGLALGLGFSATTLVTVGLWDWLTWGRPFSSLVEFAEYILIDKESSSLVRLQPWYWYLWRLPKWLPLTVLPMFFGQSTYRWLRAPFLCTALPLFALSLIHHKDMRYLQGILPFVAIAVAGAVCGWWVLGRRRAVATLMVLSLFFGIAIPTFVFEKSMAAVEAAESMAADPNASIVSLSQAWAYGSRLYLPEGTKVRELGAYPSLADLKRVVPGSHRVALYRDRLEQVPELETWLLGHGFETAGTIDWGWSRSVVVFQRSHSEPTSRGDRSGG